MSLIQVESLLTSIFPHLFALSAFVYLLNCLVMLFLVSITVIEKVRVISEVNFLPLIT